MTTTVKIESCAWPVQVQALDAAEGEEAPVVSDVGVVQPNSTGIFHAHAGRKLLITELPIPQQSADDADQAEPASVPPPAAKTKPAKRARAAS